VENIVIKGSRKRALFFATLAFFIGFAGVSAYGPIVPILKKTLILSPFFMSLLVAAPSLTGSLLRIPFGALTDKIGGKVPILILIGLSMAGIAGMSWFGEGGSYGWLIALGMLAGCGIAIFSVGVPTIAYWYPQKSQGSVLAIYGGIGNAAPGIFALLLPLLITQYGFSISYLIWLSMLLLGGSVLALFMHDAPSFQFKANGHNVDHSYLLANHGQELLPSGKAIASIKTAAVDWNTWVLTGIYFATFGGFIALTAWFPIFWTQSFGMSLVMAGTLTAAYSLSTSIIRVFGGFLADKFGGERVLIAALVTMLIGSVVMILSGGFSVALTAEIVMASGMGAANAAVFKLVPKFAPGTVGGSAGIVGGLGAFGGFMIPLVLGGFVSRFENAYTQAFAVFAILAVISIILLKTLRDR